MEKIQLHNKGQIIKVKFEGIFKENSIDNILLNEYEKFNKLLENKNEIEFILSNEELELISISVLEHWKILNYKFRKYTTEFNALYRMSLDLESEDKENKIEITKSFVSHRYKFKYNNIFYYCFIQESLINFFREILQEKEFYVIAKINGERLIFKPHHFLITRISNFEIIPFYQYQEIKLNEIVVDEIYNTPLIIKGKDLNLKLGLYSNLMEEEFYNFEYYNTKQRQNFLLNWKLLLNNNNSIGLCGPFGSGKTITLLKLLIENPNDRMFYFNLRTISSISYTELIKLFKYEALKLFGENIFNKEKEIISKDKKKIYEEIIKEIEKFDEQKNIFLLLENILHLLKDIQIDTKFYIIIDQYSSKYDENNSSLKNLLKINKKNNNINIIVSSSINNYDIKKFFSENLIYKDKSQNLFLDYYYLGCFLRLNQLQNYKDLLKNKSNNFIKYLNKFGNLPLYYYKLSQINDERYLYIKAEEEKKIIINEINLFYTDNNKGDKKKFFIEILKLLSIVNKKEIYFIKELPQEILNLPLKFLEIKKEEISLDNLKVFAFSSNNQKLLEFFSKNDNSCLQKLILDKNNFEYRFKFINEDNFCMNYIKPISDKKRKKILSNKIFNQSQNKITIIYLDFLFPFMEEILSSIIYNLLNSFTKNIFQELLDQSQEELFEYIIDEFVKNRKEFMNILVSNFECVDSLVPNNFFIQDYSSRKIEALKTYIENKDISNNIKKELPKSNIFINISQLTAKYYDYCLLIYKNKHNTFIMYLFQVSKKRLSSHRYYREEHKIIFNRVKKYLENRYLIVIDEGYFSYILNSEYRDESTIKFCNDNSLKYYLFSLKELNFKDCNIELDEKSLITKEFPIHSSFSILPKESFIIKDGNLKNKEFILDFENKIKFKKISDNLVKYLKQNFIPKHYEQSEEENEFSSAGDFNEMFNVNPNFCIWFNNETLSLIYISKNKKEKSINIKVTQCEKLSKFKYSLICSKCKIKYVYEN